MTKRETAAATRGSPDQIGDHRRGERDHLLLEQGASKGADHHVENGKTDYFPQEAACQKDQRFGKGRARAGRGTGGCLQQARACEDLAHDEFRQKAKAENDCNPGEQFQHAGEATMAFAKDPERLALRGGQGR